MSKRIYMGIIMFAAMLAYGGASRADEQFTLRSLRGAFGFSGSGTLFGFPAAVVGLTRFDGKGGCVTTAILNATALGTTVIPLDSKTGVCTYTVNPDGTGAQIVEFAEFPARFTSNLVIVDGNKEVHFMLSDDRGGTVASGVSKRQAAGD